MSSPSVRVGEGPLVGDRVIVAMSGGVDSSACAAILVDAGYDVVGVTMRLGMHDSVEPDADKPSCCGVEGIHDARRVAARLGIPYYAVNYEQLFAEKVVDYFTDEYLAGRTPNPCVMCNQELKFGKLLQLADELDAEFVATGHYARIGHANGRRALYRALDQDKDQSYVLFSLSQEQMARTMLPLGDMSKPDVRALARSHGLANSDKPESQEICFIADDDYRRFLRDRIESAETPGAIPGEIVNGDGEVLGEHPGTAFYTVGQRRGLGITAPGPLYVTEIDAPGGKIVVGSADQLMKSECRVSGVNWLSIEPPTEPIRARIKIRYRDAGALGTVDPRQDGESFVKFDEPRRAITPGQVAVFYDGDLVLGGGWIV